MLFLVNTPLSLLGLIPGLLPIIILFQEPLNLLAIGGAYLLTQQFPNQAMLIWTTLLF